MAHRYRRLNAILGALALVGVSACEFNNAGVSFQEPPNGTSEFFGTPIVLSNGNVVVADPGWDSPTTADVGAVYLYDGLTHQLISRLTGSTLDDQVGAQIAVLANGNFVVGSPLWGADDIGAVTVVHGTLGLDDIVGPSNSFLGVTTDDRLSSGGIVALTNSNFVIISPSASVDGHASGGAVTWGNGAVGMTGTVSTSNSLYGGSANDAVGSGGVYALANGNYVVRSTAWDNPSGPAADAGAVTWGNGTTGTTGVVSSTNSVVGSVAADQVGLTGVAVLTNGNYVIGSHLWGGVDQGAATWASGTSATSGVVSSANSLVGSSPGDKVSWFGILPLTNGNYLVKSPMWSGGQSHVGAATWGNGTTGTSGAVSSSNSLVGTTTNDEVGFRALALTNGNYVVMSESWDIPSGTQNVGAITWGNGTTGTSGAVSTSNSLYGGAFNNFLGFDGLALANGNYVVSSPSIGGGAIKWVNGAAAASGAVTDANSLTGDSAGQNGVVALTNGNFVMKNASTVTWVNGATGVAGGSLSGLGGNFSVEPLTNGNYVVAAPNWTNPDTSALQAGAVIWADGTTGRSGAITAANSLHGSTADDRVGLYVLPLTNGNYVIVSPQWDNGGTADVGAVTWGNGVTGTTGAVGPTNSLYGSTAGDSIGDLARIALPDGNFAFTSSLWDNAAGGGGVSADAGAATWVDGAAGSIVGPISSVNSMLGMTAAAGPTLVLAPTTPLRQLVVGQVSTSTIAWMTLVGAAPVNPFAVRSGSSATIMWTPSPYFAPLAHAYQVTATPGGKSCTTTTTTCTIKGLKSSTNYRFDVAVTNALGSGPPAAALVAQGGSVLASGKTMERGRYLLSADGRTRLALGHDGNLVLTVNGSTAGESNTAGLGVTKLRVNKSGALELLDAGTLVLWSSGTSQKGASLRVLDGTAVLRSGTTTSWTLGSPIPPIKYKSTVLSSGRSMPQNTYLRSKNKQCGVALLAGNLVSWGPGGVTRFASNLVDTAAVTMKLQTTGDLQLLKPDLTTTFTTGTSGKGAKLTLTNDCRLVLATSKATLWTRG